MKSKGRNTKLTKEQIKEMVNLYLESELSQDEVGERYGVSRVYVGYHVRKETEQCQEDQE